MCLHLCKNEHFLFLIRSLFKFSSDWCLRMVCRRKMRHHEDLTFHIWASINNIFLNPFNPPCCQLACYLTPVSAVRQQSHHSAMEGKHDVDTGNLESQMTLCASERVKWVACCPPFRKHFIQHSCSAYFLSVHACVPPFLIADRGNPFSARFTSEGTHIQQKKRQAVGTML